jgi:hypothetical protein
MAQVLRIAAGVFIGILLFTLVFNYERVLEVTSGWLTGWDDKAKINYADFLKDNKRALEAGERFKDAMLEFERKTQEIRSDSTCAFRTDKLGHITIEISSAFPCKSQVVR